MRNFVLEETNWKHLRSKKYSVAILPWGATEPHNYHLPYGTDTLATECIAQKAVKEAQDRGVEGIMVLPPIPFGCQNPGQVDLPFCLHISHSTQQQLLCDLVQTLYQQEIKKIVIINGHGGNDLKPIIRDIQLKYRDIFVALIDWFRLPEVLEQFDDPGDHAGEMETSIMQYLFPQLVLPLNEAGTGLSRSSKLKGLNHKLAWTPRDWSKISDDTGVGSPKNANTEKGQKCTELLTKTIVDFLIELVSVKNGIY